MSQHQHRPTLKQSNKSFKSKHASKGALRDASKGRVPSANDSSGGRKQRSGASLAAAQNKANRKNAAKQIQAKKRAAIVQQNRLTRGKEAKAPRVVAVIQLCQDVNNRDVVHQLLEGADLADALVQNGSVLEVETTNPRATLQFLTPAHGDLFANLDAVSVADIVVLSLSGSTEVDTWGETCLRSLASLGVGEGVVRALVSNLPENAAAVQQVRKSLHSFLQHFFPSLDRVHAPSVPSEATNLVRSLGDKAPRGVTWRESRARVLAEHVEWQADPTDQSSLGTLALTGVVRGSSLSANRLVHLQGFGDFQVEKILSAEVERKHKRKTADAMDDVSMTRQVLSEPTPSEADDLESTNVPSDGEDLLAEQTWPTEEEIAGAPANTHRAFGTFIPPALPGTTPKRLKKVPKGTSAYQAAWIPDEDDDEYLEDDDDEEADMQEDDVAQDDDKENGILHSDDEYEYIDPDGGNSVAAPSAMSTTGMTGTHQDLPMQVEQEQYEKYLADRKSESAKRQKESKDDLEFPDEVNTPLDIPARERFARYRGLKSFRTSAWDAYENLPRDYARCFMFQDWKMMGKKLAQRAAEDGIEPGTRVTVYIKDVPQAAAAYHTAARPLMLFGLLKHEHKYSVVNFTTTRNTEYEADIKSKDPVILQLGCRRFSINPIWSQHTQGNGGKGSNNVHKFERFLRHGPTASVGTAYLPITFGSSVPAIVFQRKQDAARSVDGDNEDSEVAGYELVGTGSLLGVDPTRIVAKRIILTGHPYKVHKKTATIRYMFFNQPDVDYFKPVELRTKKGRVGHIRESLGTHGYFKAGFDGPIDQMDTICLNLYKRCFPKWGKHLCIADEPGVSLDNAKSSIPHDVDMS